MHGRILDYLKIGLIIFGAVCFLITFISVNHRSNKRNQAPIETAKAVVYCKHPDMEPYLIGRHSTYVCYITFHTDHGEILKLYMNPTDYHSIPEGSQGELTWQADRFWKFEKEE